MELSDSERSINFPPKIRQSDFDEDEDIECDNPEFQIHSDAFQDVRDKLCDRCFTPFTSCLTIRELLVARNYDLGSKYFLF
jgi:hypothetical protein